MSELRQLNCIWWGWPSPLWN